MLDLVYVFRLLDVGWDSRSVVFSDLSLHDMVVLLLGIQEQPIFVYGLALEL